jgi:hypothetical protein
MKLLKVVFLVLASIFLVSCGSSNNNNNSSAGTSDGGGSSSSGSSSGGSGSSSGGPVDTPPVLTAADQDSVAPCPSQSILTDAPELDALKQALLTGAVAFLDVPFDSTDADNFKKKCGLEGFWDPANNVNEVTPANVGITKIGISQLLTNGNAGICSTGALPTNNITGFPAAGTYRTEIKAADGPSMWHLRFRTVVSGSSAGNEFAAESIAVPADIENTLEYKVSGTVTAHDDVFTAIVNALSTSGSAIPLEVSKSAGGPSVFSSSLELICATKN